MGARMQENVRVSQGFPVTQPFLASPGGGALGRGAEKVRIIAKADF